jgi:hypothetical protein
MVGGVIVWSKSDKMGIADFFANGGYYRFVSLFYQPKKCQKRTEYLRINKKAP